MPGSTDVPRSDVHSVHRAFDILEVIAESGDCGVTELANRLDLPVSTIHNLLRTLHRRDYLARTNGRYRLGAALTELRAREATVEDLRNLIGPALAGLTRATGASVLALALDGFEAKVIGFEPPPGELVVTPASRSRLNPLSLVGGRVLVAMEPTAMQRDFIERWGTAEPDWTAADWLTELEVIAQRGLAIRRHAPTATTSVAIPVWSPAGTAACSIASTLPTGLASEPRLRRLIDQIWEATSQLSRDFGVAAMPYPKARSLLDSTSPSSEAHPLASSSTLDAPTPSRQEATDQLPIITAAVVRPVSEFGTIRRFPPPRMIGTGPRLIHINNPEALRDASHVPSVLYRDTVTGWVRLMTHQQNQLRSVIVVESTVTNNGDQPVDLWLSARGVGLSQYPAIAGQVASRDFLASRGQQTRVATLPPGSSWCDADTLAPMTTKTGMWELRATTTDGIREMPVLVGATVRTENTLIDPVTAPIAPAPPDASQRATHDHADRSCTIDIDLTQGAQQIAFHGPGDPQSEWYDAERAIPGEYVPGVDAVDGGRPTVNNGNYGALYDIELRLRAAPDTPTTGIWVHPTGGPGNHVNVVEGTLNVSPFLRDGEAWFVGIVDRPFETPSVHLTLTLTAGSFGAVQLIVSPGISA